MLQKTQVFPLHSKNLFYIWHRRVYFSHLFLYFPSWICMWEAGRTCVVAQVWKRTPWESPCSPSLWPLETDLRSSTFEAGNFSCQAILLALLGSLTTTSKHSFLVKSLQLWTFCCYRVTDPKKSPCWQKALLLLVSCLLLLQLSFTTAEHLFLEIKDCSCLVHSSTFNCTLLYSLILNLQYCLMPGLRIRI